MLEVGEGVEGFTVGQRVMGVTSFPEGHGGFAEQALAHARGAATACPRA